MTPQDKQALEEFSDAFAQCRAFIDMVWRENQALRSFVDPAILKNMTLTDRKDYVSSISAANCGEASARFELGCIQRQLDIADNAKLNRLRNGGKTLLGVLQGGKV